MSVLYLLIPLAIALAGVAAWACVRAILSGQFEDLETPAERILWDDEPLPAPPLEAGPPGGGPRAR
ncbi:MAG: cbb3-type cytochrome oxidase assembly protein CcoS [Planctomycetes bacterium]|nr:cbb3-type cytochrome oxidase assembly protein CcoS [Planctomycetota bacterium]